MFVFEAGAIVSPRYIINFPTKKHWKSPSRLEYIELGLKDLVAVIRDRRIKSIAIPPLGADLGRLEWTAVRSAIDRALAPLTDLRILLFEPRGAPSAEAMHNRTPGPRMTPGRAAVLALMHRYLLTGYDYLLSMLEIQKLAYLLQETGEPLRLEYKAYYYGPYADNLRHVLDSLEGHYIRGFADHRSTSALPR